MAIRRRIENGSGMMPAIQPFQALPDGRLPAAFLPRLNDVFRALVGKINGMISFGDAQHSSRTGNVDGQWIRLTTPASANVEFAVPHGLGRTPVGVSQPYRSDKAARLYDSNPGGWNESVIYLKCDVVSASVTFWII